MVSVKLKGDIIKDYDDNITISEVAKSLGMGLYKSSCAGKINGKMVDLRTTINQDCDLEILTFDDEDGKQAYWHTTSHVLAQAVKRIYPNAKLAIGPSISRGFYYDFDLENPITQADLLKIEDEMNKIIKENLKREKFELEPNEAINLMNEQNQPYKVELIKEHSNKGEKISFYKQGEFIDLCAGPHLLSTGCIKAVKLTNCTGAYWRGDSNNKMLQRIYGISFPKASMLNEYLEAIEEAKKRDHNKIGRELGYFTTVDYIGQGLPILMPKGSKVIQLH